MLRRTRSSRSAWAAPILILLDYLLPGGGSTQVIAAAEAAGLPVVIMSGDAERSSELSSGSHPLVAKPFYVGGLVGTVRAALGRKPEPLKTATISLAAAVLAGGG